MSNDFDDDDDVVDLELDGPFDITEANGKQTACYLHLHDKQLDFHRTEADMHARRQPYRVILVQQIMDIAITEPTVFIMHLIDGVSFHCASSSKDDVSMWVSCLGSTATHFSQHIDVFSELDSQPNETVSTNADADVFESLEHSRGILSELCMRDLELHRKVQFVDDNLDKLSVSSPTPQHDANQEWLAERHSMREEISVLERELEHAQSELEERIRREAEWERERRELYGLADLLKDVRQRHEHERYVWEDEAHRKLVDVKKQHEAEISGLIAAHEAERAKWQQEREQANEAQSRAIENAVSTQQRTHAIETESMRQAMQSLEAEAAALRTKLAEVQTQHAQERGDLLRQVDTLQRQIDATQRAMDAERSQWDAERRRMAEQHEKRFAELSADRTRLESELAAVREQFTEAQRAAADRERDQERWAAERTRLVEQHHAELEQLRQRHAAEIRQWHAEAERWQALLAQRAAVSEAENAAVRDERWRQQEAAWADERRALSKARALAEEDAREWRRKAEAFAEDIAALEREISAVRDERNDVERRLRRAADEIRRKAEAERAELERQFAELRDTRAANEAAAVRELECRLDDERRKAAEDRKRMEQDVVRLLRDVDDLAARNRALADELARAEEQRQLFAEKAQRAAQELSSERTERDAERRRFAEERRAAEERYDEQQRRLDRLLEERAMEEAFGEEVRRLQEVNARLAAEAERDRQRLDGDVVRWREEAQRLRGLLDERFAEWEQQRQRLEAALKSATDTAEAERTTHDTAQRRHDEELRRIREQLDSTRAELEHERATYAELRSQWEAELRAARSQSEREHAAAAAERRVQADEYERARAQWADERRRLLAGEIEREARLEEERRAWFAEREALRAEAAAAVEAERKRLDGERARWADEVQRCVEEERGRNRREVDEAKHERDKAVEQLRLVDDARRRAEDERDRWRDKFVAHSATWRDTEEKLAAALAAVRAGDERRTADVDAEAARRRHAEDELLVRTIELQAAKAHAADVEKELQRVRDELEAERAVRRRHISGRESGVDDALKSLRDKIRAAKEATNASPWDLAIAQSSPTRLWTSPMSADSPVQRTAPPLSVDDLAGPPPGAAPRPSRIPPPRVSPATAVRSPAMRPTDTAVKPSLTKPTDARLSKSGRNAVTALSPSVLSATASVGRRQPQVRSPAARGSGSVNQLSGELSAKTSQIDSLRLQLIRTEARLKMLMKEKEEMDKQKAEMRQHATTLEELTNSFRKEVSVAEQRFLKANVG